MNQLIKQKNQLPDNHHALPIRNNKALVLVLVLWILVILAVVSLGMSHTIRLDNAVRIGLADNTTARWMARGGVYQAIGEIMNDATDKDCLNSGWYANEDKFNEFELPTGNFCVLAGRDEEMPRYGVVDEASRLNVNVAAMEQLSQLPGMTEQQAHAIVEWRQQWKTQGGDGRLALTTIRQLEKVQELTVQLLYGEDVNCNGLLDYNENDGLAIFPDDNEDGNLDRGILHYLTVYSYELNQNGQKRQRININSAGVDELMGKLQLVSSHINWILEHRPFGSIADLLDDNENKSVILFSGPKVKSVAPQVNKMEYKKDVKSERPTMAEFVRIADMITVTDEEVITGRININTAGKEVLQTLPGIDELYADQIVKYRNNHPEGFGNIAGLFSMPTMTVRLFKQVAPKITVRSNVFTVYSLGRSKRSGAQYFIEAVIERRQDGPIIRYWREQQ